MRERFGDVIVPLGVVVPTTHMSFADLTDRKKISGSKKVKFWLGAPRPKIWDRGPLSSGALVEDPRAAPNAERNAALSAAVTEKIAIEKKSLAPSSGETGGGRGPKSRTQGGDPEAHNR